LEAILFLAREPLSSRKLSQYASLADGTEARTLVRQLNHHYDIGGRAFRVEELAGGYQLLTRPNFAPWLRRLEHTPPETRLSAPALETLAVIAYRQPVLRADIEAIRGVNCGEILRQLMDRDFVRIGGRSEELGRPYLYITTKFFLITFGLRSLDDLPRADLLRRCTSLGTAQSPGTNTNRANTEYSTILENPQKEEEPDVSVTLTPDLQTEEWLENKDPLHAATTPVSIDEGELDDGVEDEEDLDDDEEDDLDDEEEEFEDDEFEDEEWEEVDDDDDWEDEDEDDWEEDEDDLDDDEVEEEEEEEEEWD
jgi:segregation and condensation protein B